MEVLLELRHARRVGALPAPGMIGSQLTASSLFDVNPLTIQERKTHLSAGVTSEESVRGVTHLKAGWQRSGTGSWAEGEPRPGRVAGNDAPGSTRFSGQS